MYISSKEESQNLVNPMAMVSNSYCDSASAAKKRRKPPGNPDPDAEVVALSPKTLLATTRYICEVCHKGFQRDQNLQLHRRGHNLPWKLKQRSKDSVKKRVFVCPEPACAHHAPTRALGDLTGIKKHYSRKHGEKKWKCEKCSKRYAVQSDWKAHSKICGTKEYLCDCGTIFSRKDSFLTHRAFCSALKEEHYMADNGLAAMVGNSFSQSPTLLCQTMSGSGLNTDNPLIKSPFQNNPMPANSDMLYNNNNLQVIGSSSQNVSRDSSFVSATALLPKAADVVAKFSDESASSMFLSGFTCLSNNPRSRRSLPGTIKSYTNSTAPCMDTAARFVPFSDGGERKTDLVHIIEAGKKTVDFGNGKLTQDFLGLGSSGTLSISSSGNPSHYEEEMDPYHQTSYLATTLETYMWQ